MILLRASTAGRLTRPSSAAPKREEAVWRSSKFNSIAITLLVPGGTLAVSSSYFPPNVDSFAHSLSSDKRKTVVEQHEELQLHADGHTHSFMGFDGNETITRAGRVQVRRTGPPTPSGSEKNCSLLASTMACHAGSMIDCHRYLHDQQDGTYRL